VAKHCHIRQSEIGCHRDVIIDYAEHEACHAGMILQGLNMYTFLILKKSNYEKKIISWSTACTFSAA
jgi:hypothetical protein